MKMCIRCGHKGDGNLVIIRAHDGPSLADKWLIDQEFHVCRECVYAILDQLSVVISNETWTGDD